MNLLDLNTKDRERKLYELEYTRIERLKNEKGENIRRNVFVLKTGDVAYTLYLEEIPYLLLEGEEITVLNKQWWGYFNRTTKNYINRFFIQCGFVPCNEETLERVRSGEITSTLELEEIFEINGGNYEDLW